MKLGMKATTGLKSTGLLGGRGLITRDASKVWHESLVFNPRIRNIALGTAGAVGLTRGMMADRDARLAQMPTAWEGAKPDDLGATGDMALGMYYSAKSTLGRGALGV